MDSSNWGLVEGRGPTDPPNDHWGHEGTPYYVASTHNARLDGTGNLELIVRHEVAPDGPDVPPDWQYDPSWGGYLPDDWQYTSACLYTHDRHFFYAPVRFEARIKPMTERGLVTAFWTYGDYQGAPEEHWPRLGEIDIVELPTFAASESDDAQLAYFTLHQSKAADPDGDHSVGGTLDLGEDLSADFHVYAVDWLTDRMIWRVDGDVVQTITRQQVEAGGGTWPYNDGPQALILQVLTHGFVGAPDYDAGWSSVKTLVDWVKVTAL